MNEEDSNAKSELDKQEHPSTKEKKQPSESSKTRPHKKHRLFKWIVLPLLTIFALLILVGGWFGFVPGLSGLMGATKPRDLGVKYTEADYSSYKSKTGTQFLDFANAPSNPNKPGKKLVFADPKMQNVELTNQELTAAINLVKWQWMPITNAQVKVSNGGIEISGNLNTDHVIEFVNFIGGVGVSSNDVATAKTWLNRFMKNAPVYVKATGEISNGNLTMNIVGAQIGRFSVPLNLAGKVLNNGTKSINTNATSQNYSAENVTLNDGSLHFTGIAPSTVYVKH